MADKYTWDDIIINPNDPRLEGAMGKQIYTADTPIVCLRKANRNDTTSELLRVDSNAIHPFKAKNWWACIILKKYKPQKSYEERQAEWIKENDIKVGDRVRAIRIWTNEEAKREGCVPRNHVSNDIVGSVVKILEIKSIGIKIDHKDVRWCLPYFVLEKVTKKYVPFDLSKEEDRDILRDKWLIKLYCGNFAKEECTVVGFSENSAVLSSAYDDRYGHKVKCFTGIELFNEFTFLDGIPVGKEVEE